jgi:hypothetical protein
LISSIIFQGAELALCLFFLRSIDDKTEVNNRRRNRRCIEKFGLCTVTAVARQNISGVANTFISPAPPVPFSDRRRPSPRLLASSTPIDEAAELQSAKLKSESKGRRRSSNRRGGGGGAPKGGSEAQKVDSRCFAPALVGHGHGGAGQLRGGRRRPWRSPLTAGAPPSLLS